MDPELGRQQGERAWSGKILGTESERSVQRFFSLPSEGGLSRGDLKEISVQVLRYGDLGMNLPELKMSTCPMEAGVQGGL